MFRYECKHQLINAVNLKLSTFPHQITIQTVFIPCSDTPQTLDQLSDVLIRSMSAITVVGGGYVGLVSAACFSRLGHDVTCIETDTRRLASLRKGKLPIREPGLEDLWQRGSDLGKIRVTSDYRKGAKGADFVFLAVGTPQRSTGAADISQIIEATKSIAAAVDSDNPPIVVIKSTVPMGTAERVSAILGEMLREPAKVVSNPEFLREGHAVYDFLRPDRVVVGSSDEQAALKVANLYETLRRPLVLCDSATAELIKYASNSFLCTKISFINELASICEAFDVDVTKVSTALGMDHRVGHGYLDSGIGWGGSCLPKDISSLLWSASRAGVSTPLLQAVVNVNDLQAERAVAKLHSFLGPLKGTTISVWGAAFKPDCDDVRDSPALSVAQMLLNEGATVRMCDPLAMKAAAREMPDIEAFDDVYEASEGADAVFVATGWQSFQSTDFAMLRERMRRHVIIDGRNTLDPAGVIDAGFAYAGMGRPSDLHARPEPRFGDAASARARAQKVASGGAGKKGVRDAG